MFEEKIKEFFTNDLDFYKEYPLSNQARISLKTSLITGETLLNLTKLFQSNNFEIQAEGHKGWNPWEGESTYAARLEIRFKKVVFDE